MRHIILITGGQRSGKSARAEQLALSLAAEPVYVATAHVWDEEFGQRVQKHQARRGPQWTTIEEEKHLGRLDLTGRVAVIDCVTLWLTNLLMEHDDIDAVLATAKGELEQLVSHDATYIFVTNEIGLGGVSPNALQRRFADLQGAMNQHLAALADEVTLMVAGIAVKVK